jgi:hypothetical protein
MSKRTEDRDFRILVGITGYEDPASIGVAIEEDYLIKRAMEDRREQGLEVPEAWLPELGNETERNHRKQMAVESASERELYDVEDTEYDGKPDPIDRYYGPKCKTVEII